MYYPSIFKKTAGVALFSLLFSATAFAAPPPPPVILAGSVFADNITQTSAVVHFKTQEFNYGFVNYCSSVDPASCQQTSLLFPTRDVHTIIISGLTPNTTYYYQAQAENDNEPPQIVHDREAPIANWYTFHTLEDAAPVISNVRASAGETTATIEFETNEEGTTGAMYCPSPAPVGVECIEAAGPEGVYVRFHSLNLTGLTASTLYYYYPYSADRAGNGGFYYADPQPSFRTSDPAPAPGDTSAPRIEQIKVTNIAQTSAIVNWETRNADGSPDLSNSFVEYCRSADRATCLAVSNGGHVEKHALTLSGLSPNTRYYYEIRSTDPSGNLGMYPVAGTPILDRPNFMTLEAPVGGGGGVAGGGGGGPVIPGDRLAPIISNIQVNIDTNVTITWTTNELSNSIVDFGETSSYSFSAGSGTIVTSHRVVLTPATLQPNTLYHYRVRSTDQFNNTASSTDRTFRTRVASSPAVSGGTPSAGGTPTPATGGGVSGGGAAAGTPPGVTSPAAVEGEEPAVSEVKPFGETVFEPVTESSVKFPILAFLFVLFGIALMYVLARGNRRQAEL